eukprot:TRINITY_DN13880_c0_g1_i3.p1 TRINITY_DN13880_c0_g1~~TRINITY_DN13880_c0_g1_i3.p1  ORF type:complete len:445 (-),score=84.04 TRINITY_DN13880_c0_g1_i3:124-1458(-)
MCIRDRYQRRVRGLAAHEMRIFALCVLMCAAYAASPERRCPTVTRGLVSKSVLAPGEFFAEEMELEIVSSAPHTVNLFWISHDGGEVQLDTLRPGENAFRTTFPGHVFRARHAEDASLLLERRVESTSRKLTVTSCNPAADTDHHSVESLRFQALVLPQAAGCVPVNDSSSWSCVRAVPQAELTSRTPEAFGFQAVDQLDNPECAEGQRGLLDTVDQDYSSQDRRHRVTRLSRGPGFIVMAVPTKLREMLERWADSNAGLWKAGGHKGNVEYTAAEEIAGCFSNTHAFPFGVLNVERFPDLAAEIVGQVQEVAEWWTKQALEHTGTYGMRVYRRNAMLINHVDRLDTHLASAVIQVVQQCDEGGGWPLEVVGGDGVLREIYLQPGQMVLYEGARHLHGRPMRFRGDHFGNIFTHFKPRGMHCLLYTSDAADEEDSVDLCGRRII